jgi:PEGA domain
MFSTQNERRGRYPRAVRIALDARCLPALLAGVLLVAGPSAARAEDPPGRAQAQYLLDSGNRQVGDGDYVGALEHFRAAYKVFPSAKILLNIGTTLRLLGRNDEAATYYETYLRDPAAEPGRVADLRRILGEIEDLVGHLVIKVNRPGATVRLDGVELTGFTNGLRVRVDGGPHTLVADAEGYTTSVLTVSVARREERTVSLELLRPGERTVVVERIVSGPQRNIGLVMGGLGALAVLGGGAAGIVALAQNKAAQGHCFPSGPMCDQQGIDLDGSARTSATASTVLFSAGGGLVATGLILVFTSPRARVEPASGASSLRFSAGASPPGGVGGLGGAL